MISLSMNYSLDQSKASNSESSDSIWINLDNQCPLLFRYNNATGKCECSIDEIIHKDSVKCSKEGDALILYNEEGDSYNICGICPYLEILGRTVAEPEFVKLPDVKYLQPQ